MQISVLREERSSVSEKSGLQKSAKRTSNSTRSSPSAHMLATCHRTLAASVQLRSLKPSRSEPACERQTMAYTWSLGRTSSCVEAGQRAFAMGSKEGKRTGADLLVGEGSLSGFEGVPLSEEDLGVCALHDESAVRDGSISVGSDSFVRAEAHPLNPTKPSTARSPPIN